MSAVLIPDRLITRTGIINCTTRFLKKNPWTAASSVTGSVKVDEDIDVVEIAVVVEGELEDVVVVSSVLLIN